LIRTASIRTTWCSRRTADNTFGPAPGTAARCYRYLNAGIYEQTGDEAKAQGWFPIIIDTNANGRSMDYVQPNQPVDPTRDKRLNAGFYGVGVNPVDGTIWAPFSVIRVM